MFQLLEVVELEEDPRDSIAEVGIFVERRDGGSIVGDRLLPRVRTYSADGTLEAAFGRFGSGPWEFRGRPHTLLAFGSYWVGQMLPYGRDIVFLGAGRDSERSVVDEQDGYLHRLVDGRVAWSSWASPYSGKPYWSSFGGVSIAAAGDSLFIMPSLLYPATILNGAGDSVGTIGTPPPSFRRIPEIPLGYFAFGSGEAPSGDRMAELLASFDLVPRIDVVGGQHLVFTLGR